LRCPDGGCTTSELQVISLTGGLLSIPKPLHRGSKVKMMFLTQSGPVLGSAEMLNPITHTQQPFRFLSLRGDDQHRLQTTIQSALHQKGEDSEWIDKYRAAIKQHDAPRRRLSTAMLAFITGGVVLATAFLYIQSLFVK
jgi:hypothetical protein